jgi:hypothetical protein
VGGGGAYHFDFYTNPSKVEGPVWRNAVSLTQSEFLGAEELCKPTLRASENPMMISSPRDHSPVRLASLVRTATAPADQLPALAKANLYSTLQYIQVLIGLAACLWAVQRVGGRYNLRHLVQRQRLGPFLA